MLRFNPRSSGNGGGCDMAADQKPRMIRAAAGGSRSGRLCGVWACFLRSGCGNGGLLVRANRLLRRRSWRRCCAGRFANFRHGLFTGPDGLVILQRAFVGIRTPGCAITMPSGCERGDFRSLYGVAKCWQCTTWTWCLNRASEYSGKRGSFFLSTMPKTTT